MRMVSAFVSARDPLPPPPLLSNPSTRPPHPPAHPPTQTCADLDVLREDDEVALRRRYEEEARQAQRGPAAAHGPARQQQPEVCVCARA